MNRWLVRGGGIVIGVVLIVAGPQTRVLGVFVLVASLFVAVASEMARRNGSLAPRAFARTYNANGGEVFRALQSVIQQLGYRVTSVDAQQREVAFNTGMSLKTWAGQDFTGSVSHASPGKSEVRLIAVTSQRGLGSIQSVSWGEGNRLGNRVLERLAEELTQPREPRTDKGSIV